MTIATLLKVSRPRFWVYLLGPVALAYAASGLTFNPMFFVLLLYATFPANLLIYGINDIFDRDTDALNDKKTVYEHRLGRAENWYVVFWIIVSNVPFLVLFAWLLPAHSLVWIAIFLLTGIGYSAPPIRAKTKPFLDAAFNVLYACLGFAAYTLLTGTPPAVAIIAAAAFWCMAMHAYSAVPDITPDKRAGLRTIATALGAQRTILLCALLYAASAVLVAPWLGSIGFFAGSVYMILMGISYRAINTPQLMKIYTLFPIVNTLIGMGLWLWIVLLK